MPTYYENIKKVTSNLLDGGLSLAASGSRPTILVCGPAKKGLTNFPQLCVDAGDVERFYGEDTVLEKKVGEILAQAGSEAYFIYVMRVGGTAPTIEIHDENSVNDASNILRITPLNYKDAQALERLGLILIPHDSDGDNTDDEQRFVLYDLENEEVVWDSHDLLGDGEQLFEAELEINSSTNEFFSDSSGGLYSHACDADKNIVTTEIFALMFDTETGTMPWDKLAEETQPFTQSPVSGTVHSVTSVGDGVQGSNFGLKLARIGNDGEKIPLMQRYAFLARALDDLAFNEFDYIIPVGSYFIDAPNIADCTEDGTLAGKILHHEHPTADTLYDSTDFSDLANITPSVPEERIDPDVSQKDVLGWLWEGTHRNKRYYYFAKYKGWKSFDDQEIDITIGEDNFKISYTLTLEDNTGATHDIAVTPGADWDFSGLKILTSSQPNAVPSGSAGQPLVWRLGQSQTLTDAAAFLATLNAEINTLRGTVSADYVSLTIPSTFTGSDTMTPGGIGGDFAQNVETNTGGGVTFKLAVAFDEGISSYEIDAAATATHSIATDGDVLKIQIFLTETVSDLETALNGVSITGVTISSVSTLRTASAAFTSTANFIDSDGNSTLEEEIDLTWKDNYYTHKDLTGEEIPSAIEAKFAAANKAEFRECSFPHLVGSYCHESSTVWKTTMSCMSVQPPLETTSPFSGTIDIGQAPEYTSISGDLAIDTVNDGGTGILGLKFIAGAPGYRDQLLSKAANSSDGYAYGGLILTKGSNLPKGTKPYGIDDNDEAKDEKGFGIDIGKYIVPCGMWVNHSNSANGGASYSGSLTGLIAAKIGITPFGEEPIGISNGRVTNVSGPLLRLRYPYSSIDDLSGAGYATLIYRPSRGGVTYINNLRTMAHKFSDYRKVSTVRSVNTVIQGIRELAEDYIGLAYNSSNVASLRTAINGYLRAQQVAGVHNGAVAQISFNRQDRILGNINIRLTMVPPFAIESITVTTSLVADQSSL